MRHNLARRAVAEFLGTAFLVAAIVGSGIMGERLAGGNVALALLCNTVATGAALVALILALGPISGAHFNPVVTIADAMKRGVPWAETPHYIVAQTIGGVCGTVAANVMFGLKIVSVSQHDRGEAVRYFSEFVATFGLLAAALAKRCVCGGSLHNGGVLVYGVHFVCQSGGDNCEIVERHIYGDSASEYFAVHRRRIRRRNRCDVSIPVAAAEFAREREGRGRAAPRPRLSGRLLTRMPANPTPRLKHDAQDSIRAPQIANDCHVAATQDYFWLVSGLLIAAFTSGDSEFMRLM